MERTAGLLKFGVVTQVEVYISIFSPPNILMTMIAVCFVRLGQSNGASKGRMEGIQREGSSGAKVDMAVIL